MFDTLTIKSRIKDYDVNFVDDFVSILKQQINEASFMIIDEAIMTLYEARLKSLLSTDQFCIVEATESNKNINYCQDIIKIFIERNIKKNSVLIAVGGGITQDITAFISSILFRGIDWIFCPSTLLAQADSCIGSKTSINFGGYKNLLGGFYPPSQIYIDLGFLETLPADEIKSGIGEILHFYLIAGSRLSEELMDNYDELIACPEKLKGYMLESLKIKKNVIEVDEFDKNERNLFNYGHTFGHAIEAVSGYEVSHGQAVTMGMDIANFVSMNIGYLSKDVFESMHKILARNMPPFHLQNDTVLGFFEALSRDKKNIGKTLGCILTSGPGSMRKVQIPFDDQLKNIVLSYFKLDC